MLADDFLLLALADDGTNRAGEVQLHYGLAGAVLLDLVLAGRIDLDGERIAVRDATPTGDPIADDALDRIAAADQPRTPDEWLRPLTDGLRDRVIERQVEAGVLRRQDDRVLWVFPRTRYPSATGTEPAAETEVRRELAAAVDGAGAVPARAAALLGLVQATGLVGEVLPGRPGPQLHARLAEIADGNWAAAAVRVTIARIQAVVASMAAITAATAATTTIITS
ncbi:GPP34 family phosphoprotein [Dactylosporangium sp. NPDC051541]|uniref:GOLPH3/VPS74 family protein n=1 Tax=Dactylosporangium sp. NPDC051541 TaxID=3363977 RepID=UPI0037B9E433